MRCVKVNVKGSKVQEGIVLYYAKRQTVTLQ